jgi:hypothetical protein
MKLLNTLFSRSSSNFLLLSSKHLLQFSVKIGYNVPRVTLWYFMKYLDGGRYLKSRMTFILTKLHGVICIRSRRRNYQERWRHIYQVTRRQSQAT